MNAVGDGRSNRRLVLLVAGCVALLVACGGDESPAVAPTTSSPDAVAAPAVSDDGGGAAADPMVVSAEGTAVEERTDGTDDGAGAGDGAAESGSGAADLDAEPLPSDETGDVPAGPPAPAETSPADDSGDDTNGSTVPGGAVDQAGGTDADPADDPDPDPGSDSGGQAGDPPGPTIDTDTSPDAGDVPNGVSGDTDVRENLSYPPGPVIALGRGATTNLASELAGSDQPTLLWFWTPDCPTCEPESASVARFAETYRGSIRVLGVGSGGSRADADQFASSAAVDASLLVWEQGSGSHDHYNVTATPFAIMVAPNGVVMAQWRGMVPELFAFADRL